MKASTIIATIFAGVVMASPVANEARNGESKIEKRCVWDSCEDCYNHTPPQGPGGIGSSTGHIIYCATSCC